MGDKDDEQTHGHGPRSSSRQEKIWPLDLVLMKQLSSRAILLAVLADAEMLMDLSCYRRARNQNFPATCRRNRRSCGSMRQKRDRPSIGKPASHPHRSPLPSSSTEETFHLIYIYGTLWLLIASAYRFPLQPVLRVRDLVLLEGRRRYSKMDIEAGWNSPRPSYTDGTRDIIVSFHLHQASPSTVPR